MTSNAEFERHYRAHYRPVLALCRRLLGRAGYAEDAAQEAFMRAYRAFAEYDSTQPFGAWVARIARNHCIDLIRRRTQAVRLFDDEDAGRLELPSTDASALAELVSAERAATVQRAIDELPDRYRIPLVLAYLEGASYDEIAATLGITRNHVGVLILRAKKSLRTALAGTAVCSFGDEA